MSVSDCDIRDPRIKRTRALLQDSLRKLLEQNSLDAISVQDIAGDATVNRATFYDHYADKYALFEAMAAGDFHKLLQEREVRFDGSCSDGLTGIVRTTCEFVEQMHTCRKGCVERSTFQPLMEAAIIAAIRRVLLAGMIEKGGEYAPSREIVATTAAWAIYGAAKEWFENPDRAPAAEAAPTLVRLLLPLLESRPVPDSDVSPAARRG